MQTIKVIKNKNSLIFVDMSIPLKEVMDMSFKITWEIIYNEYTSKFEIKFLIMLLDKRKLSLIFYLHIF